MRCNTRPPSAPLAEAAVVLGAMHRDADISRFPKVARYQEKLRGINVSPDGDGHARMIEMATTDRDIIKGAR